MNDAPAAGTLEKGRHRFPVRVYYEDTDFSGFVYHASYLRFLERGRTELLRALSFDQSAVHAGQAEGFVFVVRRIAVEYLRPARMDDILVVETAPQTIKAASVELSQDILCEGERILACRVLVAAVSGGRPRRLPNELRAKFAQLAD